MLHQVSTDVLAAGSRLGRYELIRRLAIGGMAEIHLARHGGIEGFQKLVVLKRILPSLASSPEFISMFLDEARLAATLQHPNIAQVYDIGQAGGSYYFTMEFVHGEDVRNIRKQCARLSRRLPFEHALNIVIGAAAGLHAAHEKIGLDGRPLGIVHRDVSPSNILVSFDGCVKVVDFGVAKASQRRAQTKSGILKGKVAYLSPEQCRGQGMDRRSDVFSLGNLLYLLTTGRRPFAGETEVEVIQEIAAGRFQPPSHACGGRYPFALEAIVMKALAREPELRYQTAQDLFSEKLTLWRLRSRDDMGLLATRPPAPPDPSERWLFDDVSTAGSGQECELPAEPTPAPPSARRKRSSVLLIVLFAIVALSGFGLGAFLAARSPGTSAASPPITSPPPVSTPSAARLRSTAPAPSTRSPTQKPRPASFRPASPRPARRR